MTSSPTAHIISRLIQSASELLIFSYRRIATADNRLGAKVRLLNGVKGMGHNPCNRLNLGQPEIETPAAGIEPRMRFLLFGHR